jgi:hypothetical protein
MMTSVHRSAWPFWTPKRRASAANAIATVCCYVAVYVALDWISFIQPLPGSGFTPWNYPHRARYQAGAVWPGLAKEALFRPEGCGAAPRSARMPSAAMPQKLGWLMAERPEFKQRAVLTHLNRARV